MARQTRLQWIELPDGRRELGRYEDGIPTFGFRQAPPGLATRRQLRTHGLCPGRQDIVAQLKWARGRRWAGLYRLDLAQSARIPTPAQRHALNKAMTARRTCVHCGHRADYYLPTTTRICWGCDPDSTSTYDLAA